MELNKGLPWATVRPGLLVGGAVGGAVGGVAGGVVGGVKGVLGVPQNTGSIQRHRTYHKKRTTHH